MNDERKFLEMLVHWSRCYGWTGDHEEVIKFVWWVYNQYGMTPPTSEQLSPLDPP